MVPYPFSKGLFVWGAPVIVDRDADENEIETKRRELQQTLNGMTEEADAQVLQG